MGVFGGFLSIPTWHRSCYAEDVFESVNYMTTAVGISVARLISTIRHEFPSWGRGLCAKHWDQNINVTNEYLA